MKTVGEKLDEGSLGNYLLDGPTTLATADQRTRLRDSEATRWGPTIRLFFQQSGHRRLRRPQNRGVSSFRLCDRSIAGANNHWRRLARQLQAKRCLCLATHKLTNEASVQQR